MTHSAKAGQHNLVVFTCWSTLTQLELICLIQIFTQNEVSENVKTGRIKNLNTSILSFYFWLGGMLKGICCRASVTRPNDGYVNMIIFQPF